MTGMMVFINSLIFFSRLSLFHYDVAKVNININDFYVKLTSIVMLLADGMLIMYTIF